MLLRKLADFFQTQNLEKTFWVAYSGGLDSHVLLSLCHELQNQFALKLRVIHINHQINPQAELWEQHCSDICKHYKLPFTVAKIDKKIIAGESLEAWARTQRYQAMSQYMQTGDMLLTAHHQNDQAETFLLQLLRGAGVKGLSAMPGLKKLGKGFLARPLLNFTREQILAYAKVNQLKWIEDHTNADQIIERNFVRHTILPLLKEKKPSVTATIARSANHCAEAEILLTEYAELLLPDLLNDDLSLNISSLLTLSNFKQKLILRAWLHQGKVRLPSEKKLTEILSSICLARNDRMPCVEWDDVAVRRYQNGLYLTSQKVCSITDSYEWDFRSPLRIPGFGTLRASLCPEQGLVQELKQVQLHFRCSRNERPFTNFGNKKIKKMFQEWGIPPWQRGKVPFICTNQKIISIVPFYVNEAYAAKKNELGWVIQLEEINS